MAAAELRSYPFSSLRAVHQDTVVLISSSPEFPSICELLPAKKPALRGGSNAAPIPQDAPTAFTSAARVWQSSHLVDPQLDDLVSMPIATAANPSTSSSKIVQESAAGGTEAGGTEVARPRGDKPRKKARTSLQRKAPDKDLITQVTIVDPIAESAAPPKKPARKPPGAKDPTVAQTTLPQGKVSKLAAKGGQRKRTAETVSRHFAAQALGAEPGLELVADPIADEAAILEPAMRRRMDWTPPRDTASLFHRGDPSAMNELSSSLCPARGQVFDTLLEEFGRTAEPDGLGKTHDVALTVPDVLGKRKLIELVASAETKQPPPEISPVKAKAPKKKPRTITELATAAYRQPDEEVVLIDTRERDSLLGYLETTSGGPSAASEASKGRAKGAKRPAKPKAKTAKKKEEARKPLLLSPSSALRQVAKQDFVFGTASQLAIEDDPDLLRALHEAMQASNQFDDDAVAEHNSVNSKLTLRRKNGAGLWAAGARGEGGDLLDLEALDLTGSSPLHRELLLSRTCHTSRKATSTEFSRQDSCIEIESSDDSLDFPILPSLDAAKPKPCSISQRTMSGLAESIPSGHDRHQLPSPADEANLGPPPSNQEQHQLLLSQSNSPGQAEVVPLPPRPDFELFTDARLAKEVASYGFKAVKRRTAMIALLDQCWASRNTNHPGNGTAHVSMSTSTATHSASPSRPRGRPRKVSAPAIPETAEEITRTKRGGKKSASVTESEAELPPVGKRPRGRPRKDAAASPAKLSKGIPATSPKRAKSPPKKPITAVLSTPRRRKSLAKLAVVEIPDSDSETDPFSSSSASPSTDDEQTGSPDDGDVFSSPPAIDLSAVTEDTETSLVASPTSAQVSLFRYITQAVISAPRTKNPAEPSWHEMMLMYDPVILEDLTAWLNAGQLDRVGYDGEVAPGDVKKWCESKSVCCLWRVSLKGKERKRF